MEEDDIVKSRYGSTLIRRRTNKGGKGCKPKGAYKEVLRSS